MPPSRTLLRYWGSHFKSPRQVAQFVTQFEPLIKRGWTCHLVLERLPEDREWLGPLQESGVQITCIPRPKGSFDLENMAAIRRLCRETGCDVFHCDNMHMSPLIGAALARVPVRIWCKRAMNAHYEQCREPSWKERLALTSRLSVMLTTRVIAVSSAVAEELIDFGMPASKFHVLNNPRPEMKSPGEPRAVLRERLGIPQDTLLLVAIGRVERVKGWDVLFEAFKRVAADSGDPHLLLVGTEDVRGQEAFARDLKNRVAESGLARRVHFTGHSTEVPAMLGAADVFVLPSRSEGCCNALLEALEVGLPCVASRVGNAEEALGEDGGGMLVPRNDPEAMGVALRRLVADGAYRTEMASKARIPDTVCDRKGHAVAMADLYQSLLEVRSARP